MAKSQAAKMSQNPFAVVLTGVPLDETFPAGVLLRSQR